MGWGGSELPESPDRAAWRPAPLLARCFACQPSASYVLPDAPSPPLQGSRGRGLWHTSPVSRVRSCVLVLVRCLGTVRWLAPHHRQWRCQWRQRHMWMCVSSAVHLSRRMRGPALRARSVSAASVVGEDCTVRAPSCTVTTFQDGKHRRQRVGRGGGKHGGALAQVEMLTDPAKIDRGRGRRSTNQAAPKSNQPRLQQVGTRPTPFGRADGGCTGRGVAAARRRHATAGALAATAALTLLSPQAAAQSTGGRRRPA